MKNKKYFNRICTYIDYIEGLSTLSPTVYSNPASKYIPVQIPLWTTESSINDKVTSGSVSTCVTG